MPGFCRPKIWAWLMCTQLASALIRGAILTPTPSSGSNRMRDPNSILSLNGLLRLAAEPV